LPIINTINPPRPIALANSWLHEGHISQGGHNGYSFALAEVWVETDLLGQGTVTIRKAYKAAHYYLALLLLLVCDEQIIFCGCIIVFSLKPEVMLMMLH